MKSKLRILQLIDSLDTGGAERMAINYANTLAEVIPFSALVTTRKEGALKEQLSDKVGYLFLNKQGKLGFAAVLKLRKYIKQNKIKLIHAHSTSFFTAVLVKLTYPKIRIVWHDHHGNRVNKEGNTNKVLKLVSTFFYGVLAVNEDLEMWAKEHLYTRRIQYFPNFISTSLSKVQPQTILKGEEGKRIVFLANLKEPKNHLQVLKAFASSQATALGWSLHLIGNDFNDVYSDALKRFIADNNLHNFIFIYDSCTDVESILEQSNIGVLGSTYEGFPVTLLEYGKASLCVVSTDVGYCKDVIQDSKSGLLFNPNDLEGIINKLNNVLTSPSDRLKYSQTLHTQVMENYSDRAVIHKYLEWLS